jgi:hypothetical protein
MKIDLTAIAALATAIWLLVAVLKRAPQLAAFDSQLVALVVALLAGAAAVGAHYVVGNPVEIGVQLVLALFGANAVHDKITAPLVAGSRKT